MRSLDGLWKGDGVRAKIYRAYRTYLYLLCSFPQVCYSCDVSGLGSCKDKPEGLNGLDGLGAQAVHSEELQPEDSGNVFAFYSGLAACDMVFSF